MEEAFWGLERRDGSLHMDSYSLVELAGEYATPLYIVSEKRLKARCGQWREAFADYPKAVHLRFSYKTNAVAGILQTITAAGIGAEVTNAYELWLARKLRVAPGDTVLNGPNKSDDELIEAVDAGLGLIVVDGLPELRRLIHVAESKNRPAAIALRVCPDVIPHGMNASSLTGSRRNQFGMDLRSGELDAAISEAVAHPLIDVKGIHTHIGSGIHDIKAFRKTAKKILAIQARLFQAGATPTLIDLGGGLGARYSFEFSTFEFLRYLAFGQLPKVRLHHKRDPLNDYAAALNETIQSTCRQLGLPLPELVFEPGRALVSDAAVLLLRVGATRHREGVGDFALTDGGAMTVSMVFLSEYHRVLLANRKAKNIGKTSVFGRLPSPLDVVYRNLPIAGLRPGDLLAVMDAGAYFTSTATNFGGPRPAVVMLEEGGARLIRRRETFDDLARTEVVFSSGE